MRPIPAVRPFTLPVGAALVALLIVVPALRPKIAQRSLHRPTPADAALPADPDPGARPAPEGGSLAHGALAGVLPISSRPWEEAPAAVASHQASPFDREFADLLETLHKGSSHARTRRPVFRIIGDFLSLSGTPDGRLREQTLLDPEIGEISLSLAERLGRTGFTPSRGRENYGAETSTLRAFEANLLAAIERTAPAAEFPHGSDYSLAPIGANTSSSTGGSIVIMGDPGSSVLGTDPGALSVAAPSSWSGLPSSAPVTGTYTAGSFGGGWPAASGPLNPSLPPIWTNPGPARTALTGNYSGFPQKLPSVASVSTPTPSSAPAALTLSRSVVVSAPVSVSQGGAIGSVPGGATLSLGPSAAPALVTTTTSSSVSHSSVTPLLVAPPALPALYISDGSNVDVVSGGSLNTNFITNVNQASGLAVGADGTLYVASLNDEQVYTYNPTTGVQTGTFVTFYGSTDPRSVSGPYGMVWGPDGNLYISDVTLSNIHIYSGAGASLGAIGGSSLVQPVNVAFNRSGQLFVADAEGIEMYNGSQFSTYIQAQSGGGAYVLNNPGAVAFSAAGNMYVLDISSSSPEILEFTGTTYDGPVVNFNDNDFGPEDLVIGPDGRLYVSGYDYDSSEGEVLAYNLDGSGESVYATGLNNPNFIAFAIPEPTAGFLLLCSLGIWGTGRRRQLLRGDQGQDAKH